MINEEYNMISAATYLFWSRIMKEHAIFIESSLPPPQSRLAVQAKQYHNQFSQLFRRVILLSNGVLTEEILASEQFLTDFTETAERDFEKFFGVTANIPLTVSEQHIKPFRADIAGDRQLRARFSEIGGQLLRETEAFVLFQQDMLNRRVSCKLFFGLYPSALNHLMKEAKRFIVEIKAIESADATQSDSFIAFWNQGMSEHAKSLRGELDWTEEKEIHAANDYAEAFDMLASAAPDRMKSLEYNTRFAKYAENVTQNFIGCKLLGIMSGLYCDHLLREVNHFNWALKH